MKDRENRKREEEITLLISEQEELQKIDGEIKEIREKTSVEVSVGVILWLGITPANPSQIKQGDIIFHPIEIGSKLHYYL